MRWLRLTWPQFWDGLPAAVLDASMAAGERIQKIEDAMRLGMPEIAESQSLQQARTAYLKAYWKIRNHYCPPKHK